MRKTLFHDDGQNIECRKLLDRMFGDRRLKDRLEITLYNSGAYSDYPISIKNESIAICIPRIGKTLSIADKLFHVHDRVLGFLH